MLTSIARRLSNWIRTDLFVKPFNHFYTRNAVFIYSKSVCLENRVLPSLCIEKLLKIKMDYLKPLYTKVTLLPMAMQFSTNWFVDYAHLNVYVCTWCNTKETACETMHQTTLMRGKIYVVMTRLI